MRSATAVPAVIVAVAGRYPARGSPCGTARCAARATEGSPYGTNCCRGTTSGWLAGDSATGLARVLPAAEAGRSTEPVHTQAATVLIETFSRGEPGSTGRTATWADPETSRGHPCRDGP